VGARDPIGRSHFLDGDAPITGGVHVHEHAQCEIRELGELHGRLRQHVLDSFLTHLYGGSNFRKETFDMYLSMWSSLGLSLSWRVPVDFLTKPTAIEE